MASAAPMSSGGSVSGDSAAIAAMVADTLFMFEVREKPQLVERALLVGVYHHKGDQDEAASLLEELRELVGTLGIGIVDALLVRAPKPHAKYLMGTGKAQEVIEHGEELGCDCIIFDNQLSPAQQRAWERDAGVCVIDREEVILDIFNLRAQTKEARLQVELARMEYSLPRLARMWAHLDRQGGGGSGGTGGAARGEGEKQIEVDRRLARKRIDRVKAELAEVRRQRSTQRKEREKLPVPHGAIVGYTNAGKSTLLNHLTGADVFAHDQLFATLDTTTRRLDLPDGQTILLTDTVGFVRNLPHRLVEAFKATLEEAILADFLIHVLDASQPLVYEFYQTTLAVLEELGAQDKKMIVALNKIDLIDDPARLHELEIHFPGAVLMSVKTGQGIDGLTRKINEMVLDRVGRVRLRIPQSRADLVAVLHRDAKVLSQEYEGNEILAEALVSAQLRGQLSQYIEGGAPRQPEPWEIGRKPAAPGATGAKA
ncbi:MAG: GTPase HflX [Verrucomicrobiales bacterium]